MRVVVLYHPVSELGGMVSDYAAEFERYKGKKLELISLEAIPGSSLAELYGVTNYPAVMVMSDTGSLIRMWQGSPMPLMDELSYYVGDNRAMASREGHLVTPVAA